MLVVMNEKLMRYYD